jgi:hypothetical protein
MRVALPSLRGEMPTLGNKGKVFCSFVEYHWETEATQVFLDSNGVVQRFHHILVKKRLTGSICIISRDSARGNHLAFSSKGVGQGSSATTVARIWIDEGT